MLLVAAWIRLGLIYAYVYIDGTSFGKCIREKYIYIWLYILGEGDPLETVKQIKFHHKSHAIFHLFPRNYKNKTRHATINYFLFYLLLKKYIYIFSSVLKTIIWLTKRKLLATILVMG